MSRNNTVRTKITVNEVIAGLIVFILAGCGFVFMHIKGVDVVEKSEATEITASFESFDYSQFRGNIHYIDLVFADAGTMRIDSSLASEELIDIISGIPRGTKLYMLVDEPENLIMELRTDNNVLINFEEAQHDMKSDKIGLAVLGVITVSGGSVCLLFILRKQQKGLREKNLIDNMINPV